MDSCEEKISPEDILSTVLCKVQDELNSTHKKKSVSNPWMILDNFRVNFTDDRVFSLIFKAQKYDVKLKYLSQNSFHIVINSQDKSIEMVYPQVNIESIGDHEVQINIKNNNIFKAKVFKAILR